MAIRREYNFIGGMPDPASFPIEGLIEATERALRRVGGDTLVRYPGDHGNADLREIVTQRIRKSEGIEVPPSDVAITSGSMQAIDLVLRACVRAGDTVLVEQLSYMGTLGALRHYGARIVGIPVDEDGMNTDALEETLKALAGRGVRPALLITIPVNQNPTGATLSKERRRRMISLAEEFDVLILEDVCYADITFEGRPPSAMYGQAPAGRVAYVGTFSKVIGPGVRLGYLVAPPLLMNRILAGRYDGGTSALASVILAEYLREHMWEHIERTNAIVRAKRDALIEALDTHLGGLARCRPPSGGLFAWVRLPDATDMNALMDSLAERGVICTRGRTFHADGRDIPYVRFSYGFPTLDDIHEGIRVFGDCVRLAQPASAPAR